MQGAGSAGELEDEGREEDEARDDAEEHQLLQPQYPLLLSKLTN